jgi:hypothetical protein
LPEIIKLDLSIYKFPIHKFTLKYAGDRQNKRIKSS